MDVLNDEQRMLQDTLTGVFSGKRDAYSLWSELAQLGMLGAALPEAVGGLELGIAELLIFARTAGQHGVRTPFFASEILAVPILADLTTKPEVLALIPDLQSGSSIVTYASEDLAPVRATVSRDGTYRLDGAKTLVPAGSAANHAIVTASSESVPAVFLVDLGLTGVERRAHVSRGSISNADIALSGVIVPSAALLAQGREAETIVNDTWARGQLATCAEMLGEMESLLELTVEYLRSREQFGQPLANFQVLQHLAVDMYVEIETARAMMEYGTRSYGPRCNQRPAIIDAVKLKMNIAAKTVGECAVQLHGGIGMTMESKTGRLFADLTAARLSFGDSRSCMNRLLSVEQSIALM